MHCSLFDQRIVGAAARIWGFLPVDVPALRIPQIQDLRDSFRGTAGPDIGGNRQPYLAPPAIAVEAECNQAFTAHTARRGAETLASTTPALPAQTQANFDRLFHQGGTFRNAA